MSTTHKLKTWPEFFNAIVKGTATAQLRANDRDDDFLVGDRLQLCEWNPANESYTGREVLVEVTHVLAGSALEMMLYEDAVAQFVLLSIRLVKP